MRLAEILKGIKYKSARIVADLEIKRITDDSRSVAMGDMFVAFRGYAADGYKFINEAAAIGASVIVAEKAFDAPGSAAKILVEDTRSALPAMAGNFYGHPSEKIKVIGVTGTNGKTTITYIIESILKDTGDEPGVIGTISYRSGGRTMPAKNTTPGSLELQSMLAEMAKSSSPLNSPRPAKVQPSSKQKHSKTMSGWALASALKTGVGKDHAVSNRNSSRPSSPSGMSVSNE